MESCNSSSLCMIMVLCSSYEQYDYASVGGAPEAYGSRLVCVLVCVCVCNSVPPISRRALKTKR